MPSYLSPDPSSPVYTLLLQETNEQSEDSTPGAPAAVFGLVPFTLSFLKLIVDVSLKVVVRIKSSNA